MLRPAPTGLATAFFRFYLLDAMSRAPARPAAVLARVEAERLPFGPGPFGRALRALLEGGHLAPTGDGMVGLTALGAAELAGERERWTAVTPCILRLVGDVAPRPAPVVAVAVPPDRAAVADVYAERVLVRCVRERVAAAREGGRPFGVVLVALGIGHPSEATRRAMVQRTIRASLGATATLFGGDVTAFRYGDAGLALIAERQDHAVVATLARARIDELIRAMTRTTRAFGDARWQVRAGGATWSIDVGTTGALLRAAEEALSADGEASTAA